MKEEKLAITKSTGNVYADLAFADAGEQQAKSEIAQQIARIIKHRKLTQKLAAEILGVDQPKISALQRGLLKGFSMERLLGFLNKLDRDVEIVIKLKPNKRKSPARLSVAFS